MISKGADINVKDNNDWSLIHLVSGKGHLEIVKYLILSGVYINVKNSYYGYTPLCKASEKGRLEVVKYLISVGAYINVKNNSGDTPLDYALRNGHLEVVKYLISVGAR